MLGGSVEYIEGENFTTRSLQFEGGESPPLILLHGIGGHAETYLKNLKILSERMPERSIYAIDFIGHGYSSKPQDVKYSIPELADHIEDFINAVGFERAHIHGESLGGWVAGWIGLNRPDLAKTIGLNTTGGTTTVAKDIESQTVKKGEKNDIKDLYDRTMEMLDAGCPEESVRHRLDWLFVDDPDEELIDIRYEIYQQESVQNEMKTIYDTLIKPRFTGREDLWMFPPEKLEVMDVPTLIIHSVDNPGTSVETIERVHELIPNSSYYLYQNSAHWPQWEEPELFNDHTTKFIKEHSDT